MLAAITSFVYGSLVLLGGIIGFRKAGSRASLIAGIASEFLLLLAAALSFHGHSAGATLAMAVAALLFVFFMWRWFKGRKFMPAGLMVVASAAALVLLAWGSF